MLGRYGAMLICVEATIAKQWVLFDLSRAKGFSWKQVCSSMHTEGKRNLA